MYAFEHAGITPDIVSSAKGIGGGFPLGATLVTERVGAVIPAGSHGSTYGSNPLAMAVGNAVLDLLLADGLFAHVQAMGARLVDGLRALDTALVKDVRGVGLMVGLEPTGNAREMAAKLLARGLTTSPTVTNVLRLVPPLNVSEAEIDEALSHLAAVLKE
jgi:acetylornithine/N-succinyldiaminopimelate aminotransferase